MAEGLDGIAHFLAGRRIEQIHVDSEAVFIVLDSGLMVEFHGSFSFEAGPFPLPARPTGDQQ